MNSDISIIGFSSVSAITSLLLAEKGIEHSFFINKFKVSPLKLPPLSNPLVNGPTQEIEKRFLPIDVITKAQLINEYEFSSYSNGAKPNLVRRGRYKTPLYALDSRIRFHCFLEKIKGTKNINIIENQDDEFFFNHTKSKVSIIGGGEGFSKYFETNKTFETNQFKIERKVLFFNVQSEKDLMIKYSKAKMWFVEGVGEISIYPFLNSNYEIALNITVMIIKNKRWDVFSNGETGQNAFKKAKQLFSEQFSELVYDLNNFTLIDDYFKIVELQPYYKIPVNYNNKSLFMGVGESITKNDPVTGQGYNLGVKIASKLTEFVGEFLEKKEISTLMDNYSNYSDLNLGYIYHVNKTITQGSSNQFLSEVYVLSSKNESLNNFLISAFDDISLNFPWLIDEKATKELIQKYK